MKGYMDDTTNVCTNPQCYSPDEEGRCGMRHSDDTREKREEPDLCPKAVDGVHKYFEIRKLFEDREGKAHSIPIGVLVKCALCKQSQELWEE
jgi:hypothetical protein